MIWYIIESTEKREHLTTTVSGNIFFKRGWGNGYVAVPPTHPLHLEDITQDKISLVQSLNVNGGVTYSNHGDGVHAPEDWWVFGFDTNHSGDTIEKWSKEAIEAETKRLYCQLLDIELGEL